MQPRELTVAAGAAPPVAPVSDWRPSVLLSQDCSRKRGVWSCLLCLRRPVTDRRSSRKKRRQPRDTPCRPKPFPFSSPFPKPLSNVIRYKAQPRKARQRPRVLSMVLQPVRSRLARHEAVRNVLYYKSPTHHARQTIPPQRFDSRVVRCCRSGGPRNCP